MCIHCYAICISVQVTVYSGNFFERPSKNGRKLKQKTRRRIPLGCVLPVWKPYVLPVSDATTRCHSQGIGPKMNNFEQAPQ